MEHKHCDNCKEEIGRWHIAMQILRKERDFGLEMTVGNYDFCSLKCLSEHIYRLKEKGMYPELIRR